jgi:tetratricopeptide (TPR) repeat protein
MGLGAIHWVRGELEEARSLFEKSLAIARDTGHPYMEGGGLYNLGAVLHELGRLGEARQLYERGLELLRRIGNRPVEALVWTGLSVLHAEEGRMEEAFAACGKALALARGLGASQLLAAALIAGAIVERRAGSAEQAAVLLDEADGLAGASDQPWTARLRCERGHLALSEGRPEAAAGWIREVRELASRLQCGPQSQVGRSLQGLERAAEAFREEREPLLRGECWQDLPAGLRQWLIRTGRVGDPFVSLEAEID